MNNQSIPSLSPILGLKLSDKDRQMAASNWLLNKELRKKLVIERTELDIKTFRSLISRENGLIFWKDSYYFITWLDNLEGSEEVRVSFRQSKLAGESLNYCVVNKGVGKWNII